MHDSNAIDTNISPSILEFAEIPLQTKLPDVKPAEDTNDVFFCPTDCADTIICFFMAHGIPYTRIDDPKLYPVEEIDKQLAKYSDPLYLPDDIDDLKETYGITALITQFDANALFDWAMQILSDENMDPAYRAYREKQTREGEEYYEKYEKE